jgi:hypothetical protein
VHASIGFMQSRRLPCSGRPPVWTSEVRRAVAARNRAVEEVARAPAGAAAAVAAAALKSAQDDLKTRVAGARDAIRAAKVAAVYECRAGNDGKGMWDALAALGAGRRAAVGPAALRAQGGSGGLVVDDEGIADVLAAQYQSVSSSAARAAAGFDEEHRLEVEREVLGYRQQSSHTDSGPAQLSAPVTSQELRDSAAACTPTVRPTPCLGNPLLTSSSSMEGHTCTLP